MMNEFEKNISDTELVLICNEIYYWKNTGDLDQQGLFKTLFDEHKKEVFEQIMVLEDRIIREAHNRFNTVVKLLFTENPTMYIKR